MSNEEQQQADETVVRLLGRREHSAHELRQKLRQRGYAEPIIQQFWRLHSNMAGSPMNAMPKSGYGICSVVVMAGSKSRPLQVLRALLRNYCCNWSMPPSLTGWSCVSNGSVGNLVNSHRKPGKSAIKSCATYKAGAFVSVK